MNRYLLAVASLATLLLVSSARADAQEFHAKLIGFNEVPAAILSEAQGTLTLNLDPAAKTLTYTLTYSAGFSSPILFAHIHFGKIHVAGRVIVFLCGGCGRLRGNPRGRGGGTRPARPRSGRERARRHGRAPACARGRSRPGNQERSSGRDGCRRSRGGSARRAVSNRNRGHSPGKRRSSRNSGRRLQFRPPRARA